MSKTGRKKSFVDYELPTKALEEVRGGRSPITTLATGEEGTDPVTTMAVGEEGGTFTTLALGEEGGCTK